MTLAYAENITCTLQTKRKSKNLESLIQDVFLEPKHARNTQYTGDQTVLCDNITLEYAAYYDFDHENGEKDRLHSAIQIRNMRSELIATRK